MDHATDADDWAAVLAGDGESFGRIFDRYAPTVRRQARRLLSGAIDAEDAVAVVFLETWRRRVRVMLVDGSLLPWLLVTTTNVSRNLRRSRWRYERLLAHLPAAGPSVDPVARVEQQDVLTAMRSLPLADQQVLTLCVLEGWSERDAATALGVAPGTVKSRLHRAKRRLAQRVEHPLGGPITEGVGHGA